jgi:ABC-2 type transport system ATP-binding protein
MTPIEGQARVRFRLPDIPMMEGQYFVTAAVHSSKGVEFHRLDRVAAFKVFSDANDVGVVHLQAGVELFSG